MAKATAAVKKSDIIGLRKQWLSDKDNNSLSFGDWMILQYNKLEETNSSLSESNVGLKRSNEILTEENADLKAKNDKLTANIEELMQSVAKVSESTTPK